VGSNSCIWAEVAAPLSVEIEEVGGPFGANSFGDNSVIPMIDGEGKDLEEFDEKVEGVVPEAAGGGSISMEVEDVDVVLIVEVDGVSVG
jgi:hypothetical protein